MSDLFSLPFEEDRATADGAPARVDRRIHTVSELTDTIRGVIEGSFGDLWVEGEISNCRVWATGNVFFTLKDDTSQIKAIMFRTAVRYLRFTPEDGLHVIARGRLGVYEPKGEYQLVCEHLEPRGYGARQVAFDQLKKRLHAEGLFNAARKRPVPTLPRRVGIVTSLDGAALRDILKVLRRRSPNTSVLIRPTRVQGDGAADEIARAIAALARILRVDVVIVGRGGGSSEDLWAFNEEAVARAIAASPVPIVSAVGHEVDVTIADYVADLRAPTPSAAAEMVVAAKQEFCGRIDRLTGRLAAAAHGTIQRQRTAVHVQSSRRGLAAFPARLALRDRHTAELRHQLDAAVRAFIGRRGREYRGLRQRLDARDLARRLAGMRTRLTKARERMIGAADRAQHRADARFRALAGRLENLSPLAVLGRGYAVCWNADKTAIIRSANSVSPGEAVRVTLSIGELSCRVEET